MRRVLIIVGILLIPIIPVVLVVSGVLGQKPQTVAPVTITVWGTEDDAAAYTNSILRYRQTRPYVTIAYQKVRSEDYVDQLLSAWSQGTGPDLFFVPNTWVGQMSQYAVPMPSQLGISIVQGGQGLFRNSTSVVNQELPAPSISSLQNSYVDVVSDDVIIDNQVWGLPLSLDTLVVYSNRDLLNNAKIFEPAKTWSELVSQVDVNKLTVLDEQNNLVQSAVAIGTTDNLPYTTDLLQLLLLQNGVPPVRSKDDSPLAREEASIALDFFLSFANERKLTYSWNAAQPNARDAFLAGKLAYFFGTLADRAVLEASQVRWDATPMLHLSTAGDRDGVTGQPRTIDAARYQVLMVSKASAGAGRDRIAWNLLYYLSRAENVPVYLQTTGKLAALKSLLAGQQADERLGIYAGQLLTARSWYHGRGGREVDGFLRQLINSVGSGQATALEALRLTGQQIISTL